MRSLSLFTTPEIALSMHCQCITISRDRDSPVSRLVSFPRLHRLIDFQGQFFLFRKLTRPPGQFRQQSGEWRRVTSAGWRADMTLISWNNNNNGAKFPITCLVQKCLVYNIVCMTDNCNTKRILKQILSFVDCVQISLYNYYILSMVFWQLGDKNPLPQLVSR